MYFFFYTECNSSTKHNTTYVVRIDLVSLFSLNFLILPDCMVFPDCIDVGCSLFWNISAVYWRFGIQILQLINVYSSLAVLSTANREVPGWTRVSPVIAIICMAQRFFRAVQTHSIYLRFVHVYSVAWSLGGEGRRGQKWLCHTGISCSSTLYM